MNQTLNQIADQIINDVNEGLKASTKFAVSREQIKDEFAFGRNRFIHENFNRIDRDGFAQTIHKLALTKKDFSNIDGYDSGRQELHATIPEVIQIKGFNPVIFASETNFTTMIDKVVFGREFLHTKHDKYTSKSPTLVIQDKNLWLINPPNPNIKSLSLRAVFENPRALNSISNVKITDDDPYPMPGGVIDQVKSKLVEHYIRRYRMGSMRPTLSGDLNLSNQ